MINTQRRLLNRLETYVYVDKSDETIIHIDFDNVLHCLLDFGVMVPPRQFEDTVEKILNEKIVGKIDANPTAIKIIIGKIMYDVSERMALSSDAVLKHNLKMDKSN